MKIIPYLVVFAFVSAFASPVLAAGKTARHCCRWPRQRQRNGSPMLRLCILKPRPPNRMAQLPEKPFPGTWVLHFHVAEDKDESRRHGLMVRAISPEWIPPSSIRAEVVGEFTVDSDKAMSEAIKNGLKTDNYGMNMSLMKNAGRVEWQMLDKTHFYYIDANSGRFLKKEKN